MTAEEEFNAAIWIAIKLAREAGMDNASIFTELDGIMELIEEEDE